MRNFVLIILSASFLFVGCTYEKHYNSLDYPQEKVIDSNDGEIYAFTPQTSDKEFEFSLDLTADETVIENQVSEQHYLENDNHCNDSNVQEVWITTSGSKYHTKPECSNMKEPEKTTLTQAVDSGYEPCKRCYKL